MAIVHIIGAGITGLCAASKLAEAGVPVRLYEASAHAGGRARSSLEGDFGNIDHGLHAIPAPAAQLSAYLDRIGATEALQSIPHPLRLPRAPLVDYVSALRILLPRLPFARPTAASTFFAPGNALRAQWAEPFSRNYLATPLDIADARAFRHAMLHYLRQGKRAYRVRDTLSASLITPALRYLEEHGVSIYFNQPLKSLELNEGRVRTLNFAKQKVVLTPGDYVILALPSFAAKQLLPEIAAPTVMHRAITLHYDLKENPLPEGLDWPAQAPVDVVRATTSRISISLRVADHVWHSDPEFLADRLWQWLKTYRKSLAHLPLPSYVIWREKLAGHALTAQRHAQPPLPEPVLLAGDWLSSLTPSSLEQAATSGHRAAATVIKRITRN